MMLGLTITALGSDLWIGRASSPSRLAIRCRVSTLRPPLRHARPFTLLASGFYDNSIGNYGTPRHTSTKVRCLPHTPATPTSIWSRGRVLVRARKATLFAKLDAGRDHYIAANPTDTFLAAPTLTSSGGSGRGDVDGYVAVLSPTA